MKNSTQVAVYTLDGNEYYIAPADATKLLDGSASVWYFDLQEELGRNPTPSDAEAFLAGFIRAMEDREAFIRTREDRD